MSKKLLSLYIHYPFCKSKCNYCDFYSIPDSNNLSENFLKALKREIIHYSKKYRDTYEICSLYIGGGTPSLLTEKNIEWLFNTLKTFFKFRTDIEITIEVNPESFTETLIKTYSEVGINRISMGVQTLNDRILKTLNRLSDRTTILNKLDLIKKHDVKNFSVDLIYGLPFQTFKIFKSDLFNIMKYKPKHISLYNLTINKNSKIFTLYKQHPKIFPSEKQEYKFYKFANNFLLLYGLRRYELSNFAKKKFHSYHNLRYWLQKDYLGLGPAAVSTIETIRWKNISNVIQYINKLKRNKLPAVQYEKINNLTYINEKIMLNLRLQKGINLKKLKANENINLLKLKANEIYEMKKNKLLKIKNNHLYLSLKGIMVSNKVISQLFL